MLPGVATLIGDGVPRHFSGRATAVGRGACYLRNEDGRQVVLLGDSLPPAAHGINVRLGNGDFREVVARDSRVRLENGLLTITGAMGTRAKIRLDGAGAYDGRIVSVTPGDPSARQAAHKAVLQAMEDHRTKNGVDTRAQACHRRIQSAAERLAQALHSTERKRSGLLAATLLGYHTRSASGLMAMVGYLGGLQARGAHDPVVEGAILVVEGRDASPAWGYLDAAAYGRFPEPVCALAAAQLAGSADGAADAATRCLAAYDELGFDVIAGLDAALATG